MTWVQGPQQGSLSPPSDATDVECPCPVLGDLTGCWGLCWAPQAFCTGGAGANVRSGWGRHAAGSHHQSALSLGPAFP